MNRIYQGRVSVVQVPNPDEACRKAIPWVPLDSDAKRARELGEEVLWDHHQLFQDAVNYYVVALASLGVSPESKLTKLRELLAKVWEVADKNGQRRFGLACSLQRTWKLNEAPTLSEALERFRLPLISHGVEELKFELACESLLQDLGGEGSIKLRGPEYWPYFCQSGFKRGVTFPRSADQLLREKASAQIPRIIWHSRAETNICRIHRLLKQVHFCNLVAGGETLSEERSRAILLEALDTLMAAGHIDAIQKAEWTSLVEKGVPSILAYAGGSINKDALKERFCGFLVFHFLSPTTAGLAVLRKIIKEPKTRQSRKRHEPTEKEKLEARLQSLGDDPIKLVREKSQLVFRAFTALPIWECAESTDAPFERSAFRNEINRGELHPIAWKEFDVAAFKEALKVYNQFQQNVEKREAKLNDRAMRLLAMDGERAIEAYTAETGQDQRLRSRLVRIWAETNGEPKIPNNDLGEEAELERFAGDPRIERLRLIVNADLAEEYRLTDGRMTPYGLRRRTMKGWSEVKRSWKKHVRVGVAFSEETRRMLQAELDVLRSGEKREQIGSHRLFEALLRDEDAWKIWREPDEHEMEEIARNRWAVDPLESFRNYCEMREAYEDLSIRPLNFTPADARHSRRLFIFTDVCSFGKDRGEFCHDAKEMAVTVPVAWRDHLGRYSMQRRRLVYSAPRLLRDSIRAQDGSYSQNWMQPMMRALFGDSLEGMNPQDIKGAAVQLMPDFDGKGHRRILLNFPLDLDTTQLRAKLCKPVLWENQLHIWRKGKQFPFLRWPGEFVGKEPKSWCETTESFQILAADLGTRHAASIAIVKAGLEKHAMARFIGKAAGRDWYARYCGGAILRLLGENAQVLRPRSRLDKVDSDGMFREELYGARGRRASEQECAHSIGVLRELGQIDLVADATEPFELSRRFSFPEQNDKLLVAIRRTQRWIAACVSWHWKLNQPDSEDQRLTTLDQLAGQDRVIEWKSLARSDAGDHSELRDAIHTHILKQREIVRVQLLDLTHRILPMRGRKWDWIVHPDKTDCRLLTTTACESNGKGTLLMGQRGLSIARIEQLSELRRRWQSLNQSLRRELGQKPLTASEMRNDPIPDPCPDILRKLDSIREQRVNQTAHLIIAWALGLKLREPGDLPERRRALNLHGEYEVARQPVDMIVLEDLSRYLSDQGRAKSENSRLMKWCHRAVTEKVKMLAEPFGIPVLETPAAYSSRFCSLTGVAGFRAAEVGWRDRHEFRWRVLLEKAREARIAGKEPSMNELYAEMLFKHLAEIDKSTSPHRTLLAPQPGGPIFVSARPISHPAPSKRRKLMDSFDVLPMHADINAATNLALRAIAHPACADIHHRLRTSRKPGTRGRPDIYVTREPRRFGKEADTICLCRDHTLPNERNSNLFFDPFSIADFGRARLASESAESFPYASGPGLWTKVNKREVQWARCAEINRSRMFVADIPM